MLILLFLIGVVQLAPQRIFYAPRFFNRQNKKNVRKLREQIMYIIEPPEDEHNNARNM